MVTSPWFAGIDLGSTGIRGMVVDSEAHLVWGYDEAIPMDLLYQGCQDVPSGWHEQNPTSWAERLQSLLANICGIIMNMKFSLDEIKAVCTDSTSGTVIPVDASGAPLTSALMYNDGRAIEEAEIIRDAAEEYSRKIGYRFSASFSLPKILWIKRNRPDIYEKTAKFLHANDFLVGLLSGEYFHSDSSNCLKMGYDFIDNKWPDFIESELGIALEKLPEVVPPGKIIAKTSEKLEKFTNFPASLPIISGATDSTMALIASGASKVGDVFTSLGTTLVTRVLTQELVHDPQGRVYCHVLPGKECFYLPGGASSVGAECLRVYFPGINYELYDPKALDHFPTPFMVYPLTKQGERFPFVHPTAEYFSTGKFKNEFEKYTGYLQSVAFVERLCVDVLESLGAKAGDLVYTSGGATKSSEWLQIRADVLQRKISRPKITWAAFGAVIVAASTMMYNENLTVAINKFVHPDLIVKPRTELAEKIERRYCNFVSELQARFGFEI